MLRKEKETERDRQHQARGPDAPFTGSLSSKNKPDLQEIAAALDLPEDGTKDALIQRINACFDSNPLLHDRPRFAGLFHHAPKCRSQATENTHAMASITPNTPYNLNSMCNPLSTDLVNLPEASSSAFHYNLIPMHHRQANNSPLFHSLPAGPSTVPQYYYSYS